MPSYFPENNAPLPTDSVERSLQKAVDLIGGAAGGSVLPSSSDSSEVLAQKLVRSLSAASASGEVVEEAPEDGIIYGRKDAEWVDMTAPANLQVRRGTAAEVAAITPLEGEPVWATDTKRLVIGDNATQGGVPVGGGLCKFSTSTRLLDDGDPPNDPDLTLTLPEAGAYYVKMVFVFTASGSPDLSIVLPTQNVSYVYGVSGDDVDENHTIAVSDEEVWQREFLCITAENSIVISPAWSVTNDVIVRENAYIVAIPCR